MSNSIIYHSSVEFEGKAEGFSVIGIEVGAGGEFGDDAVVEFHFLVEVEYGWK